MGKKLELPQVTLLLACDNDLEGAGRVLRHSQKEIIFGDVQLFSSKSIVERGFRLTAIAPMNSGADYSLFILKELYQHVHTSHLLITQTDGYIVHPHLWTNAFLKYDYIGAPWWEQKGVKPGTVGNGGFSLRSRALMQTVAGLEAGNPEDAYICLTHRAYLEKQGYHFAPTRVARRFSYEDGPYLPAFGFHNRWNMDKIPSGQLARDDD
jgi:hypothetical protein